MINVEKMIEDVKKDIKSCERMANFMQVRKRFSSTDYEYKVWDIYFTKYILKLEYLNKYKKILEGGYNE